MDSPGQPQGAGAGATAAWKYVYHPHLGAASPFYPLVNCHLPGTGTYTRFLIDSGASMTVMGQDMLPYMERHGEYLGPSGASSVAGDVESRLYRLPRLELMRENEAFYVFEGPEVDVVPVDLPFALLGRNLAAQLDVCLLGRRRELSITIPG